MEKLKKKIPGTTQKGLMDISLSEGVKLELCNILNHLMDIQLRHRVESLIAFAEDYCQQVQQDQLRRYIEIKQSDMPPAEAAKKTKEFRCPPREQMMRLLTFKPTTIAGGSKKVSVFLFFIKNRSLKVEDHARLSIKTNLHTSI